ncbi:MAG: penicillin-binding protein activator, partial [Desulfuromonadaceae bacterium]
YLEALACVQRGVPPGANPSYQLAHTLLREKLTPPELAEAAFMFQGTAIGRDALLQQAEQAVKRQDPQEARRLLTLVLTDPAPFPYLADAMALGEQLDYFPVQQRSIGVMLPLSGRYATFGQLVQRGMELAAEEHNRNASPIRLIFRDTGASAEESVRIVGEFAANPNVLAIAGPLTGGASVSAAEEAQRYRLPLFSLSPREGLPEMGSYIFRDSLTSRQQVQALVSYAMECLGLTTFGILHPENKLGYEMAELFIQEVQTRGGQIIATEMYSEKDTDYRYQIKLLNGEDPNLPDVEETPEDADEVLGEEEEEEVPPPFQALFIPDYADKISMIAPQLIFYGIEDVQLLGINGWNSADLLRSTGRYLQNAIFVDGFYRDSRNPLIQQFVAAYRDKYGEEPSILEAQGYDVASILLQQLQRSNSMSRQQLQQNLLLLQNYPGVSGDTTFTLAGDAYKPLFVLQIQNGKIVELNGSRPLRKEKQRPPDRLRLRGALFFAGEMNRAVDCWNLNPGGGQFPAWLQSVRNNPTAARQYP